jgi:hypothetical protein
MKANHDAPFPGNQEERILITESVSADNQNFKASEKFASHKMPSLIII